MKEYKLLEDDRGEFEKELNRHARDGWEPTGALHIRTCEFRMVYTVLVVREKPKPTERKRP